ncbi:MAG: hypothetical protein QG626_45 [Patescibacteria group bacterium]|jgi:hypothetical protein|nr:hypothetical protein [Patescibacteria group bacterium]
MNMLERYIFSVVAGVAIGLLGLGVILRDSDAEPEMSLADKCSLIGGEWLYRSADLVCLQADGIRLTYLASTDTFVPVEAPVGIVSVAQASETPKDVLQVCDDEVPKFEAFTVPVEDVRRPELDFSTYPEARKYRTAISKDVDRGVNFGGHYVLSMWGCGEGCVGSAVIDALSGEILSYGLTAAGYSYQPNSLLILAKPDTYYVIDEQDSAPEFLPWDSACARFN